MLKLFEYNWQVRIELLERRIGGPGNILYTLFHIVDVEYSWISGLQENCLLLILVRFKAPANILMLMGAF